MPRLRASVREIGVAFRAHKQVAAMEVPYESRLSSSMVLVYAVECGLKHRLMRDRRLADTTLLGGSFGDGGHDIREGLKQLRAPGELIRRLRDARTRQREAQSVLPHVLHQAYRYGIVLAD